MQTNTFYQHTQVGYTIIILLGVGLLSFMFNIHRFHHPPFFYIAPAFLSVFLFLFCALSVTVQKKTIQIRFGPGLVKKTVLLSHVKGCRVVRIPWYSGWGVRYTTRGTIYSVSGFKAVELLLYGNRTIRIGSDQPEELCRAVQARLDHLQQAKHTAPPST